MITVLETALATWLNTVITGANITPPILAVPATAKDTFGSDRTLIILRIDDNPHEVGTLWKPTLHVYVEAPADQPEITPTTQIIAEQLVTDAFVQGQLAALTSALEALQTRLHFTGLFIHGWKPGREDTSWKPYMSVVLAVSLDAP